MKTAKDPGARFAAAYNQYLNSRFGPTLDVMAEFIAELGTVDFWKEQVTVIYGPDMSRRQSNPAEHPIPQPVHQVKARVKYVDSLKVKMNEMAAEGALPHDLPAPTNFDEISRSLQIGRSWLMCLWRVLLSRWNLPTQSMPAP